MVRRFSTKLLFIVAFNNEERKNLLTNEEENVKAIVASIPDRIKQYIPTTIDQIVEWHRVKLAAVVVAYGPFKGLRFSEESFWGGSDKGAMILGLYESEILSVLMEVSKKYRTFINVGAADGYYGIGTLVNNMFEKSYCFEISDVGREVMRNNAILNGVEARITIKGEAKKSFLSEIPVQNLADSVLLVDIEGAEFDVIDESTFRTLSQSVILIEIHDWVDAADQKISDLLTASKATHSVRKITTTARDISCFDELKNFSDNDRWILCSEGRPKLMSWFRFDPTDSRQ
jgi:hypothetical protein